MNAGSKMIRPLMLAIVLVGVVAFSSAARAACVNDDDCPNSACGGDVCDYSSGTPTCKPAGTGTKGQDGWCTTTANCKCKALGATLMRIVGSSLSFRHEPHGPQIQRVSAILKETVKKAEDAGVRLALETTSTLPPMRSWRYWRTSIRNISA